MGEVGAEVVVVQRFDEAFRSQTAEEFFDRLASGRQLAGFVMSPESAFGRDRQGTVETVRRLAPQEGWQLVEVDTLEIDGARVSSCRFQAAGAAGDLEGLPRACWVAGMRSRARSGGLAPDAGSSKPPRHT